MASSEEAQRATTRQIAALTGVSSTTVSMALRDHPKISAATRRRVKRIAAQLGYRPDPDVSKLMLHLRSRRKRCFQSTLCALTTITESNEQAYAAALIRGARQRADSLGYGFSVMRIADDQAPRADLQRVLRSRGVEGLLLLPVSTPRAFSDLLNWNEFSVVSATYGVLAPQFHRVVPHQFSNMLLLCRHLKELGYRRIGLVIDSEHDVRVHHSFSAAVSWQAILGGTDFVRPLIYDSTHSENLRLWFECERPDVIIPAGTDDERLIAEQLGLRVPGPVGFATTSVGATPSLPLAGIDERVADIGARAIELLAGMIQRGEKGIPTVPTVMMVEGSWIDGQSVRRIPVNAGRRHKRAANRSTASAGA